MIRDDLNVMSVKNYASPINSFLGNCQIYIQSGESFLNVLPKFVIGILKQNVGFGKNFGRNKFVILSYFFTDRELSLSSKRKVLEVRQT